MSFTRAAAGYPELPPILEAMSFFGRLECEAALVRRRGGLLSLLLLGDATGAAGVTAGVDRRATALELRGALRLHDVLGLLDSTIAVLLPATSAAEAARVAARLQQATLGRTPAAAGLAAGVASVFGDVEGGAAAILAAAREALAEAEPGQLVLSGSLRGRPSILVVDDDLPFAQLLADMLGERGWEGHPCATIQDALQRVADASYSALFVDLVLSRGSGLDILRKALSAHPRRPVVLMSGYSVDPAAMLEVLELGPVLFVKKPISTADLGSTLAILRDCLPGAARVQR